MWNGPELTWQLESALRVDPPSAPPPTWRIALNLLDQNPHQPRSGMDEGALAELMASIRDHGLLQPITVRKVGARYQVIAGHRRLEAFRRLLADAERQDEATAERFRTIPAHEKFDVTNEEMALFALVELCGPPHDSIHVVHSVMWRKAQCPGAARLFAPHKWVYADHSGPRDAFLGSGGRNAAMIFSLRYSTAPWRTR